MLAIVSRISPNQRKRVHHVLHATVVARTTRTIGKWWWKEECYVVRVRFSDEIFEKFGEILKQKTKTEKGDYSRPVREVEIGFESVEERDRYSMSEKVEVLFSTASYVDEFLTGAERFRWDGLRKVQAATTV